MNKWKVAIVQMCSGFDFKLNLIKANKLIKEGKEQGAKYFFLPECFYSLSDGKKQSPYLLEKENEHFKNLVNLAVENEIYFMGGTATTIINQEKINRSYYINPQGEFLGSYDKIHLFKCDFIKNGERKKIDEGDLFDSGSKYQLINIDEIKIGCNICFDLRFAEQSAYYRNHQVDLLTYPSAFTVPTGKAHWEVLLKARAIENQCFVVAVGQWGQNHSNVRTYGHSMVVDPWGEVLLDLEDGEKVGVVEIDFSYNQEVRNKVMMS